MKLRIGERLIKAGVVDEAQIERAIARQKARGGRLAQNLVELGFISEDIVAQFIYTAPSPITSLKDTGLSQIFLADLLLKIAFYHSIFSVRELIDLIKMPPSLINDLLNYLRVEKYVEIKGGEGYLITSLNYSLTESGRRRANALLEQNNYAGPAPVTLKQYTETIHYQTIRSIVMDEQIVNAGFTDLVLKSDFFDQLGPAINSGKSILLYGPPGTGKSSVAKDIANLFKDEIFVPYSIYAHGQIIQVFDNVSHEPSPKDTGSCDARWVLCERPAVTTGGELTLKMLDLNFNPVSKFYEAPLQVKANNGVFIIDDFGRQLVSPIDLLNRWIVPLETEQEYLTLYTGQKFTVPFDVLIIFCTNIEPRDLVDEAFLRRIRHKIKLDHISRQEYIEILKINCEKNFIKYHQQVADYLVEEYYLKHNRPLVPVHQRDIIDHILDYARYRRSEPVLSKETIDIAWKTYFVEGVGSPGAKTT